ncbi:MAG: GAF domain-containing protein [Blastocatellia bacterium]|nr:GAF domain-containing protein [Blastocatellia bacterium]
MMKCSSCQSDLSAKTRFCPHCGHPLAEKSSAPVTTRVSPTGTAALVSEKETGPARPNTGDLKSLKTTPALPPVPFKGPPLPNNEEERLDALRLYDIMDTFPEKVFDHIVLLASHICKTPVALLNLIDRDRQWFKARVGMEAVEMARDAGLCAYTILQPGLFIISDALSDERFAAHPMVIAKPQVRFYAGVPLVTFHGHPIGTLCVMDRKARKLSRRQKDALLALADLAMAHLEHRRGS